MAGYIKPKCDCGENLIYWKPELYSVSTQITGAGFMSKIKVDRNISFGGGTLGKLKCPNCENEYYREKDNKGRIIRGKEY